MTLSNNQVTAAKVGAVLILATLGAVMTYGIFKGGVSAQVSAHENRLDVIEPKVDQLSEHAASAEADMVWIKKAVEGYDEKQTVVLEEIRKLEKP